MQMLWSRWNKSNFIGLVLLPAFSPPQKIPEKFCYFILGQEVTKFKCQKFPQKQNLTLRPGQALLYLLSFLSSHQLPPQKRKCFLPLRWTLWPWFSGPAVADERWQGWSFCMFEERICKEGTLHISQRCFRRICREMDFIIQMLHI